MYIIKYKFCYEINKFSDKFYHEMNKVGDKFCHKIANKRCHDMLTLYHKNFWYKCCCTLLIF